MEQALYHQEGAASSSPACVCRGGLPTMMGMQRVYIETTIPSYLTAKRSRVALIAAQQELTREWWDEHRHRYDLYVSLLVLKEAGRGDILAAEKRLQLLSTLQTLEITEEVEDLAATIRGSGALPSEAENDAMHVAVATVHGLDYLLSWNCRHIANPAIIKVVARVLEKRGYDIPILCTPQHLLENSQ